jgi:mannose-6-phosphate isomerase-like protein (cupin superfamily)
MSVKFEFDPEVIAREGRVFNLEDGLEYPETKNVPGLPAGTGKRRMLACPPTGARMVGVHATTLKPGGKTVLHSHPLSEEVIVFVKGTGEITLGDKVYEFKPGYVLYAPPGVPHGNIRVTGNEEMLAVGTQSPPDTRMYRIAGYDF